MKKLRVAVVGVGHLGKSHARVYAEDDSVDLVAVVDVDAARAAEVGDRHGVPHGTDPAALLENTDAVSIVVPTPQHLESARPFIERGISVLVEKPLASTLAEADELVALADRHGVVLQVGHIERFNPVIMAGLAHIGRPLFIECDRIHPFSLRSTDVSVILDLMIHDIDLVLHLTDDELIDVDALGACVLSTTEDLATARLVFQHGCTAMVKTSRVAMNRSRKVRVFSERSYMSLDLVARTGMRVFLREGYDPHQLVDESGRLGAPGGEAAFLAQYVRTEQLEIPEHDALGVELASFVAAVRDATPPVVSGVMGRRAMAAAHRIEESIRFHQQRVREALGLDTGPRG